MHLRMHLRGYPNLFFAVMKTLTVASDQLPASDNGIRLSEGDKDIALFRIGDDLFAIDNECPHYGASLSDGWVQEGVVACPWHCWQFDVKSGKCFTVEGFDLQTYPVRLEDGTAHIEIGE